MLVWPGSLPGILLVVPGGTAGFEEHEVALSRLRTEADLVAVAWGAARRHIKAGGSRGPCRGLCRQVGSLQAIRRGSGPGTAVAARWRAAVPLAGAPLTAAANGCEDEDGEEEGERDGAQGDEEVEGEWGR